MMVVCLRDLGATLYDLWDRGYIEDLNDPWAEFGCFGLFDAEASECSGCPLAEFCGVEGGPR